MFFLLSYSYYKLLIKKSKTTLLLILRLCSFILILLILFNPKVSLTNKIKNTNTVNIYVDNSQSINEHIINSNIKIDSLFNSLDNWAIKNDLNINYFSFSDSIEIIDYPITTLRYDSPLTDFSELFKHIQLSSSDNEVIIISDGAKNYGYANFDFITN